MKRILQLLLLALLIAGCKLDNPLNGNTDQPQGTGAANLPHVAAIVPAERGMLADDNPDQSGIQATVEVTFSDYMDAATISAANVTVLNTSTGTAFAGLTMAYYADARKLYLRSEDWSSGSEFLLTLKSGGLTNRYATPLDGNGNLKNDASPYDDFLTTFYVSGGDPAKCVPTEPPTITSASPDTQRIADRKPLISIAFSAGMDSLTLKTVTTPKNIRLAPADGNELPLDLISLTPAALTVVPRDSLIFGRRYIVTLASSQVKADYPAYTPEYLKPLDAKGDGCQASEPDFTWYFSVDTLVPPQVSLAQEIPNGVRIEFSALMDTSSLGLSRVQVYDKDGFLPGTIHFSRTPANRTHIEYYFSRAAGQNIRVFVSHLVRDTGGLLLDSNGNGIGGEPDDDYNHNL